MQRLVAGLQTPVNVDERSRNEVRGRGGKKHSRPRQVLILSKKDSIKFSGTIKYIRIR